MPARAARCDVIGSMRLGHPDGTSPRSRQQQYGTGIYFGRMGCDMDSISVFILCSEVANRDSLANISRSRRKTTRCRTTRCSTTRCSTTRCSTARCKTTRARLQVFEALFLLLLKLLRTIDRYGLRCTAYHNRINVFAAHRYNHNTCRRLTTSSNHDSRMQRQ